VTHPRKLPAVLSADEVARLLNATTCLKHQAALSVAYGAGLRVAEVLTLKISDIDSERMLLRVERGKGGQYRNAMLSADMLALLRQWWKVGRQQGVMHPKGWLFPGQHAGNGIRNSSRKRTRGFRAIRSECRSGRHDTSGIRRPKGNVRRFGFGRAPSDRAPGVTPPAGSAQNILRTHQGDLRSYDHAARGTVTGGLFAL
jgi:integrase